jgi:hypothetical protein
LCRCMPSSLESWVWNVCTPSDHYYLSLIWMYDTKICPDTSTWRTSNSGLREYFFLE